MSGVQEYHDAFTGRTDPLALVLELAHMNWQVSRSPVDVYTYLAGAVRTWLAEQEDTGASETSESPGPVG